MLKITVVAVFLAEQLSHLWFATEAFMSTTGADEMSRVQFFILLMAVDSREVMQLPLLEVFKKCVAVAFRDPV